MAIPSPEGVRGQGTPLRSFSDHVTGYTLSWKRPPPSSIDYVRTTQLCPRKRPFSTANQRFSSTSGEKSGLGLLSATSNPHQLIQRLEKTCGASHQGSSTSPKIDAR